MKLARNAVFAIVNPYSKEVMSFLHVNKDNLINPFWVSEHGKNGFCVYGELSKYFPTVGENEHWRGCENDGVDIVMIQSHITKASDVDFKRCMKFAQKVKHK